VKTNEIEEDKLFPINKDSKKIVLICRPKYFLFRLNSKPLCYFNYLLEDIMAYQY